MGYVYSGFPAPKKPIPLHHTLHHTVFPNEYALGIDGALYAFAYKVCTLSISKSWYVILIEVCLGEFVSGILWDNVFLTLVGVINPLIG